MAESDWLSIRNWDRWQSYRKDRGQPPWIKLHRQLMQNVEWVSLSDSQRGQLVAIWLLAGCHGGVIPASAATIRKLCFMDSEPDLQLFIDKGFISGCQDDANVTPSRRQDDAPEAEAEAETETETEEETPASAGVLAETDETPSQPRQPDERTEYTFELEGKGKKTWTLMQSKLSEYLESYPGLDVRAEIRKARQWIRDNPGRRKTEKGMLAFLTNWLNREQNSGGRNHAGHQRGRHGPQIGPGQRYDPDAKGGGTF